MPTPLQTDATPRWTAREMMILAAGVLLSLVVHWHFMIEGFGEGDAVRMALRAADAHETGVLHLVGRGGSAPRTSPMYLWLLERGLDVGVPLARLPLLMNAASVVFGALALVPMYALWRRLAGRRIAVVACVLQVFVPAFWISTVYGMPHVPAFLGLLMALVCFGRGAVAGTGRSLLAGSAAAALVLAIAMTFKADIILCGGAFLGLVVAMRRAGPGVIIAALAVPVAATVAAVLAARGLYPSTAIAAAPSAATWMETFPFTLRALLDVDHASITVRAFGLAFTAAALVAVILEGRSADGRRRLFLVAAWAAPSILFWALIRGNSARHIMAALCPVTLLLGVQLVRCAGNRPRRVALATLGLLVLNYFSALSGRPHGGTAAPSSRVFESPAHLDAWSRRLHEQGHVFAMLPGERKLVVGMGSVPYALYETFLVAERVEWIEGTAEVTFRITRRDGTVQLVRGEKAVPPVTVAPRPGWRIFTMVEGITIGDPEATSSESSAAP